jgi:hypothetical protein
VLRISKRPEPANLVHCPSCDRHEPFCYSRRHRPTPKNTLRGNPGCAVGPKTPTLTTATSNAPRTIATSTSSFWSRDPWSTPLEEPGSGLSGTVSSFRHLSRQRCSPSSPNGAADQARTLSMLVPRRCLYSLLHLFCSRACTSSSTDPSTAAPTRCEPIHASAYASKTRLCICVRALATRHRLRSGGMGLLSVASKFLYTLLCSDLEP